MSGLVFLIAMMKIPDKNEGSVHLGSQFEETQSTRQGHRASAARGGCSHHIRLEEAER